MPRPATITAALILASLLLASLLRLPVMLAPGQTMRWADAVFLAISSLTLTGLTTRQLTTQLSASGLALVAFAVEFAAIAWTTLGTHTIGRLIDPEPPPIARTLRRVVVTLLVMQLVATALIVPLWIGQLGGATAGGAALFHAVMASCHGGFAALPAALGDARHDAAVHCVLLPLMLVTSLGWPLGSAVVRTLIASLCGTQRPPLTRDAKTTLAVLAAVYLVGVTLLLVALGAPYFYESLKLGMEGKRDLDGPLDASRVGALLADASQYSVASRSGGPIGLSVERAPSAARAALVGLALVGAGPAGPASGLSVTLAAILAAAVRGKKQRTPRASRVRRALTVAGWLVLTFSMGMYLLCLSEPYPFITLALEAASAAGNANIATGVAGDMTLLGRVTLMAMMVLGRIAVFVISWSDAKPNTPR